MSIRDRRLEKGWSQEYLAQVSGLSLRTVQRIEAGNKAGLDSLNALAAAFEMNVKHLIQEQKMNSKTHATQAPDGTQTLSLDDQSPERQEAIAYVKNVKAFRLNVLAFIIVMPILYLLNMKVSPDVSWYLTVALGWSVSFILHALVMVVQFGMYNAKWEKIQVEKRLMEQEANSN